MFDLYGKTVILTGSAGRLGSEFSNILCKAGANLVLLDIDNQKNNKLAKNLSKKYKNTILPYTIDISQKSELKEIKKDVLKNFKKIDVLINNAFFNPSINQKSDTIKFETFPLNIWNQVINTNLTGIFLCCQEFGQTMNKQNYGNIINVSSIYGLVGPDQRIYGNSKLNSQVSYAATKGAIVNLTRFLAAYWYGKNIRVNTLSLGGVKDSSYMNNSFIKEYSKKTILGRMAEKFDFNGALLFLSSDASSYMTGANLVVDGGWTAW